MSDWADGQLPSPTVTFLPADGYVGSHDKSSFAGPSDRTAMNDVRGPDPSADDKRKQLTRLFLQRTLGDIEEMRRNVPQLIAGDPVAWQELRFAAQRASGAARSLELGILGACAAELVAIAEEKFAGAKLDARFLLSTTTAIETVAIELNRLSVELR